MGGLGGTIFPSARKGSLLTAKYTLYSQQPQRKSTRPLALCQSTKKHHMKKAPRTFDKKDEAAVSPLARRVHESQRPRRTAEWPADHARPSGGNRRGGIGLLGGRPRRGNRHFGCLDVGNRIDLTDAEDRQPLAFFAPDFDVQRFAEPVDCLIPGTCRGYLPRLELGEFHSPLLSVVGR